MNNWQPRINCIYPPNNEIIFEEWFFEVYKGCNTDRELLPFFPTSYWVNNNYGKDLITLASTQVYIDLMDRGKKWFSICQYDDGVLVDWRDLDVLEFNMSKQVGIQMPLISQPHPYKFVGPKKWFANFVGSNTHAIRESTRSLKNKEGYYISFDQHNIEDYCRILHESMFTLCYRGYGLNSFRVQEALQYGSIPVYISDKFISPYHMNFEYFGVLIEEKDCHRVDEILQSIPIEEVIKMQDRLQGVYESYYTYEANLKLIIESLENEYYHRQQGGKNASIAGGIEESGTFRF